MKKLFIFALAALLVAVFTLPAAALENEFGGYWRTRFWHAEDFVGNDSKAASQDISAVDTRTRLYYTAILNDNLKFVNKFEFDAAWGTDPLGDIGADGTILEIKNSYADFNVGAIKAKVGIQGLKIARGFMLDDDVSAMVLAYAGEGFSIAGAWVKAWEGGMGLDANTGDFDYYGIIANVKPNDMIGLTPWVVYATSNNLSNYYNAHGNNLRSYGAPPLDDFDVYFVGLDVDVKLDAATIWFTGIYEGGSADLVSPIVMPNGEIIDSVDVTAWLVDVGANFQAGPVGISTEFFYATGQDASNDPDTYERFVVPEGQSHYWAEIMGYGMFSDTSYANVSNNACADQISDIMAAKIGATFKPMDALSITLDVWYAALAEDIVIGFDGNGNPIEEDQLGVETDLIISYQLIEGLKLDMVGAYLFAGDATTMDHPDDANPWEVGSRLSLSL